MSRFQQNKFKNFLKIYTVLQLEDPCPPATVIESILLKFGPLLAWKAVYMMRNADCVLKGYALYADPWHSLQRQAAVNAYKDTHNGYRIFLYENPKRGEARRFFTGTEFPSYWPGFGDGALDLDPDDPRNTIKIRESKQQPLQVRRTVTLPEHSPSAVASLIPAEKMDEPSLNLALSPEKEHPSPKKALPKRRILLKLEK